MKASQRGDGVTASAWVHVEVKGSLDIPLNLGLLADLADPIVEQDIMKEAVRIAVSERLGHFGGVEVRLSSSGGLEGSREVAAQKARPREVEMSQQEEVSASSHSHISNGCRSRYCEASIELDELGRCVESIQKAYEGLLAHAQLLHELLNADTAGGPPGAAAKADSPALSSSFVNNPAAASAPESQQPNDLDVPADAVKRLATVRQLVSDMVANHRSDVVAEADALQNGASFQRLASHEADMFAEEHAETSVAILSKQLGKKPYSGDDASGADEDSDADAGLRFGLLAGGGGYAEEQHPQEADNENEEALRIRYAKLGYSPL
ncbi:hypothetical protein CUR178_06273 [Leishmania enriettii]|uniref:Uncharacterized protein n=1 Tax=Leishmania enriettii TaxID=5663 RepID=A0A836KP23_LEIEN|nr:hypothetical protein CUR178_06273 [Leishmania enriettii]